MRKLWLVASLGVGSAFGCTSLLGDFTVGSGPGTGGGNDGGGTDGPQTSDGPVTDPDATDGPVAPPLMDCQPDTNSTPRMIHAPGSGNSYMSRPVVSLGPNNTLRVLIGVQEPALRSIQVLTFEPQSQGQVTTSKAYVNNGAIVPGGVRIPAGIVGLEEYFEPAPANSYSLRAYIFPDSDFAATPAPNPIAAALANNGAQRVTASVLPLDQQARQFFIVGADQPSGSTNESVAGRNLSGPATMKAFSNTILTDKPSLVADNGSVFLFDRSTNGSPSTGTVWQFKDDGSDVSLNSTSHLFATAPPPAFTIPVAVAKSPSGKFNIAALEAQDPNNPAAPIVFRTGQVDGAKLPTVLGTDVPVAYQIGDPQAELGFDRGSIEWWGDDFLMVGKAGTGNGMTLLWLDAFQHVRTKRFGAEALLAGRPVDAMTAAIGQKVGVLAATIYLVWVEREAGTPDVWSLWSQMLSCKVKK